MARKPESENDRLDDAARAGWLYYIAGNTQDEIARKLGVSRQTAQRLVSLAVSEKLIKVRLDHPIGRCIELADRLREAYGLQMCEVVPADPGSTSETIGVAEAAAAELERYLISQHPVIVAMGTGRMLRAMAEQVRPMDCPQHKMVSLVGNIAPDGSASLFDVVSRIGDRVKAPHYPMPLPVIATTVHEKIAAAGPEDAAQRHRACPPGRRHLRRHRHGGRDCRAAARRLRPARMKSAPWCGRGPWARSPAGPSISMAR